MDFRVSREAFLRVLTHVSSIVDSRSTIPILSNIYINNKTYNLNNSIFILLSSKNETLTILCSVSKDLQSRISAKDLINALTSPIEGKGGGRVEFAQGAGKPSDKEKFVSDIPNIVQSLA